jgi:DNA-binding response OmpR family regulator
MTVLAFFARHDLQSRVGKALSSSGFLADWVASVNECIQLAQVTKYEGILVDSDPLFFGDVIALVVFLRESNPDAAIFVFARYLELEQRLGLFEAGVDDCISEPFFTMELAVRLGRSIRLRRAASEMAASTGASMLRSGDLQLDLIRRRATRLGKTIDLRTKEFLLLEYLVRNANRPVTRTMILEQLWNSSFEGLTNVVDVYISSLRRKLDREFPQKLIQTHRGIGYSLVCTNSPTLVQPPVRDHGSVSVLEEQFKHRREKP